MSIGTPIEGRGAACGVLVANAFELSAHEKQLRTSPPTVPQRDQDHMPTRYWRRAPTTTPD
jgi:hypothetical protein